MDASDDELSIWNMNSIVTYMKDNFIQILMLLSVFVIIYVVDHISNINSAVFSMPSAIPGLPSLQNKQPNIIMKNIKGKRHYKRQK
jgi:hypothetical protein